LQVARVVLSAVVIAGLNAVRVRAGCALITDCSGSSAAVEHEWPQSFFSST
jgi:hypothetical protein